MFKDFENTKKQLSELADTINKFKSEAVQLRLLELLFDVRPHEIDTPVPESKPASSRKAKRKQSQTKASTESPAKPKVKKQLSSGTGAVALLSRLYNEGYFSTPRTNNDVCTHASTNLARKIKPNEISGKLGRMVRENELARKKNADNQYEYSKK